MKNFKNTCWGIGFIFLTGIAPGAWAVDSIADSHLDLSGKFGISTDALNINPANPNNYNGIGNTFNCIGFNYWISGKSDIQLLTFINFYSEPGTSFSDTTVYENTTTWGLGLGYKYNLREPFKGFFIQLLGRVSYAASNGAQYQHTQAATTFSETWGMFGGVGFEFFLPFYEDLSLCANSGYLATANDGWTSTVENPSYGSTNSYVPYNYWQGGIITSGFNVNSISINFYF